MINRDNAKIQLWIGIVHFSSAFIDRSLNQISKTEKDIQRRIVEMREYRNRLSHNEPIWVKAPNVTDAATAIDTIRNKIEALISIIAPEKTNNEKMGGTHFAFARYRNYRFIILTTHTPS
ncbi:hypothetical protein KGA63_005420 [Escherichia coli]|nr:hypothetical protein [Escherichia coli]EHM3232184.1 hypothetical protein [Escherichia coli]MBS9324661.1 hypothetical protein [Escherichia coli]